MRDQTKSFKAVLFLVAVSAMLLFGADPQIRFKHGAKDARVTGYMDGSKSLCYTLSARSGQTMSLDAEGKGAITIYVTSPGGEKEGEPGGAFEKRLSQTGIYRICLSESERGERWSGPFTLAVEIK